MEILQLLWTCFVALILYKLVTYIFDIYQEHQRTAHIPGLSTNNTILGLITGSIPKNISSEFGIHYKLQKKYGKTYKLRLGSSTMVFITGLNDIKKMMVQKLKSFPRPLPSDRASPATLFSTNGEAWKQRRRQYNQAFTDSFVAELYPKFRQVTDYMINAIESKTNNNQAETKKDTIIDFTEYSRDLTISVIALAGFGQVYDPFKQIENDKETEKDQSEEEWTTSKIFYHQNIMLLNSKLAVTMPLLHLIMKPWLKKKINHWKNYLKNIVLKQSTAIPNNNNIENNNNNNNNKAKFEPDSEKHRYSNILQLLTNARDESGNRLNTNQLASEANLFLIAGSETTNSALSFAVYEIAKNKKIQNRLREEVEQHWNEEKGYIPCETISNEMPYLHACAQESVRLHNPAGYASAREVINDEKIGDFTIPKGVRAIALIQVAMRDPDNFDEPLRYQPERFLPDHPQYKQNQRNFIGFGYGPRTCIGMRFAYLEMWTALAWIVHHFDIDVDHPEATSNAEQYFNLTVGPKPPLNIHFTKREK